MIILVVHNEYGKFSGEEAVVAGQKSLFRDKGHKVICFEKSSAHIPNMRLGNLRAFFSGIYSFSSKKAMRRLLAEYKPDVVNVHNVYPLISPSILCECKMAGVPVVMTVHNYRLICPNGLFMTNGRICEKCCGGREYCCVLRTCEDGRFKSLGYAVRNYVARKRRMFLDNVEMYACLTEFQRERLIREGFHAERIAVVPNMVDITSVEPSEEQDEYVGYVGRVSPEKGIPTFMNAATKFENIRFKVAGSYDRMPHIVTTAPPNVKFLGHIRQPALDRFYAGCRIVVLPSLCYETFGLSLAEAGMRGKPVICSRIGGLPEIVEDGVTGLLFEPGNAEELTEKIRYLWERPELCRKMGQAGREKALREYSPGKYYKRLMAVYEKAIELALGGEISG